MARQTHSKRSGWGETHTLCGRELNPNAGHRSGAAEISSMPTCKVCRERLHPPAAQPRLPELCCVKCGGDRGLHAFMPHSFTLDA